MEQQDKKTNWYCWKSPIGISIFTVLIAVFFAIFVRTQRQITRKEAIVLLAVYILFVATQLIIK